MAAPTSTPASNLGFLSVHQEPAGFVGGYLVTNAWGRPLEFRLSSAVQPNKVQAILYGDTLHNYLCGEVIGKTLLEKSSTPVLAVIVDNPVALDLRLKVGMPVGLWSQVDPPMPTLRVHGQLFCHDEYAEDGAALRKLIEKLGQNDLSEPFARIRDAINEARKLGVARSAAA